MTKKFYTLDISELCETSGKIAAKVKTGFPESGLSQISESIAQVALDTRINMEEVQKPHRGLRVLEVFLTLSFVSFGLWLLFHYQFKDFAVSMSDFLQLIEASVSTLFFLGTALYFVFGLEQSYKRKQVFQALNTLRSLAHIIDLHQLSKDPGSDEKERLIRYLDFCSDNLSLISKCAAVWLQALPDDKLTAGVDEVESLCTGISGKIWQKIMVVNSTRKEP